MVQKQFPEYKKIHFPHQLDFATSGVLALTFNRKATALVSSCFQERRAQKQYLAIVFGHIKEDEMLIKEPIKEDETDERKFKMCVHKLGRPSVTYLQVLKRGKLNGKEVSKVLLKPETGRRHQLRVHLLHIGHPIVGDYTYAKDDQSERMMLHAWKLTLPMKTETLHFETNDPFPFLE